MELKFRPSHQESFLIYKSWFTDKELNRQLGPMDNETWEKWQEYIEIEQSEEIAAYQNDELVGVVDINLSTIDHPEYCITAIATKPQKKKMGIATAIIAFLIKSGNFTDSNIWIAHIDPENMAAIRFFEKQGWNVRGMENDMITYEFFNQ